MTYTRAFDQAGPASVETLGGKCASLVTMTAAGMPVPPGFAVTTEAFDAFMVAAGIADATAALLADLDADDPAAVDAVSEAIRHRICSCPVPDAVRAEVIDAYDRLQARAGEPFPVAVRSSATAEDLPDASFAGQQDTYLWISGFDSVAEHIRRCWASLYTSRAILYRLRNGVPDEGLSIAVGVQKMVNAKVAGVAMTLNPATGDRSKIAIDASWGVGEMVVSGQVTPDHIVLDKVMLAVVSEHIGDKHAELVPDAAGGALIEQEVDEDRRRRRCLSAEEMTRVAQMAKNAERHYRCPQDIEWALDADLPDESNLVLLQSRPETVHSIDSRPSVAGAAPTPAPTGAFSMSGLTSALLKPAH